MSRGQELVFILGEGHTPCRILDRGKARDFIHSLENVVVHSALAGDHFARDLLHPFEVGEVELHDVLFLGMGNDDAGLVDHPGVTRLANFYGLDLLGEKVYVEDDRHHPDKFTAFAVYRGTNHHDGFSRCPGFDRRPDVDLAGLGVP